MTIEEQLKEIILNRYRSVRSFTQACGISNSTFATMLKNGLLGASVTNVILVFDALGLDVESIKTGRLQQKPAPSVPVAIDPRKTRLVENYDSMNETGREQLAQQSDIMAAMPQYQPDVGNGKKQA